MGRLEDDVGEEPGGDEAAGPDPAPTEAPPRRRRPGRFRRWLVRPLGWGVAVVAVLALVLQLLLDTQAAREWGRERAIRDASAALGRTVAIERIDFSLFPPSVEVWGLEIAGVREGDTPFLSVPWAEVEVDLRSLQRGVVHLRRVRTERPRLFVDVGPEGDNIPAPPPGEGDGPPLELQIDRVEVDQAVIDVDHREAELSLSAAAVRARLRRSGDGLAGLAVAQEIHLRLPDAQPIDLAAAGQVGLFPDRVEIRGVRLTAHGLGLQVDGQCRWRPGPSDLLAEVEEAVDPSAAESTADAAPPSRLATKCLLHAVGSGEASLLGDLGYLEGLDGRLDVDGSVGWRPGSIGFRGSVETASISLLGRRFEDVRGTVAADRYGIRVGVREATWHGGRVRADVALDPRAPGRPVSVEAVVEGVALGPLLAAEKAPVRELATRVSGPLRYRFPAADPFAGDGSASLTLTADPGSPGLPLEGTISPLRVEKGILRADSIGLRSAEQSVLATGQLELRTGHGRFEGEVASAALPPLLDLVLGADPAPPRWRPISGAGRVGFVLELAADGPRAELQLALEDVATPVLGPSTVTGHLVATRDAISDLRLDVAHGESALLIAGRVDLAGATRASLVLDARDCPFADARPWLPVGLPLDGSLSGRLELEIDGEASQGRVRVALVPARLAATGEESAIPWPEGLVVDLDSLSARLAWDERRLRIEELVARAEAGSIVGSGSLDLDDGGSLDLRWRGTGLDVAREPLRSLAAIEQLGGRLDVEGRATGPRATPSVDFGIRLDELVVGERVAEAASALDVHLAGGRLSVRGRLLGRVEVDGGGSLGGERPSLAFRVATAELGPVVRLFAPDAPPSLGGAFAGTLHVTWPEPSGAPAAELRLDALTLAFGGHELRNLRPVVLAVDAGRTEIRDLHLREDATGDVFAVRGGVGHTPAVPLDLEVEGTVSPRWVELVVPALQADGRLSVKAAVSGPAASPRIEGEAKLSDGRLALASGFPHAIEGLEGRLLFADGAVVLDGLRGRLAGGEIAFEGRITLPDGETATAFQLGARANGLRVRYPEGWTLEGDADLAWRSLDVGSQLAGRADLRQVAYGRDIPLGFLEIVRAFLRRQRLEVEEADTALAATQIHVLVSAPSALRVHNNVADLAGSAELVLRGSLARPVLYGEAVFDAGGHLIWNSTEYTVERARLTFANPYRLDPEIDLVATTEVREYDVSLAVAGTLDRLETRFASDPPLPDLEVFQLLASGGNGSDPFGLGEERRSDETEPGQSVATSAASFLYGQAASAIGERVGSLFGFDKFRIDPLTGSGDNLSTARITVGKRLSKDLFATYSVDPSSTEDQRLQLEWKLREGLALVLTQNGDETYSVDARWESSF